METNSEVQGLVTRVPEEELEITPMRSSGPGGQNVNRRETKVRLRWNPNISPNLSQEERERVVAHLRNEERMKELLARKGERFDYMFTKDCDLLIIAHEGREQGENKAKAIKKFYSLLEEALRPESKRKPLRKPSPERRLEQKRRRSEKLRERQPMGESE